MVVHKGVGHYGAPITLNQAKKVMAAAEAKAKQNNWSVAVSIVDSGGHAVMLHRLDGTQLASIRIAEGKARVSWPSLASSERAELCGEFSASGLPPSCTTAVIRRAAPRDEIARRADAELAALHRERAIARARAAERDPNTMLN